jgi:N-acetylmuramoyl-L-alanine amidase family 2
MTQDLDVITYIAKSSNYGGKRTLDKIKYIVVHFTANNGDTARGNGNYFAKNDTGTSAHYFVDERDILRSVNDNYVAYHCGAAKYYHAYCRNSNSIGVELCSRRENNKYYFKDEVLENGIRLIKYLMEKYDIPIENVVRHYDVTHKNCPAPFVESLTWWQQFKDRLLNQEDDEVVETGNISVNGKDIKIDKIVKDDSTFIKLRGLESAGFNVNYNVDTKALILDNEEKNINIKVDGEEKIVSSININGSNYIHIRALETLLSNIKVDYENNEIILNTTK